jgi:hypothetical protein
MTSITRQKVEGLWEAHEGSQDQLNHTLYTLQSLIESMGRALDHMDPERILLESHNLRSACEILGAHFLSDILSELESAASFGDMNRIGQIRTHCEEEMIRVLSELSQFLNEKRAA